VQCPVDIVASFGIDLRCDVEANYIHPTFIHREACKSQVVEEWLSIRFSGKENFHHAIEADKDGCGQISYLRSV
jgi:hypothetical protein